MMCAACCLRESAGRIRWKTSAPNGCWYHIIVLILSLEMALLDLMNCMARCARAGGQGGTGLVPITSWPQAWI
jgi:hypothetical protein